MSISTKEEIAEAGRLLVNLRNQRLGEDGLHRVGRSICRSLRETYGADVYKKIRRGERLVPIVPTQEPESE